MRVHTKRNHVPQGSASRPISAQRLVSPPPATTGDNNNTLSSNLTFIKCLQEGQVVGYVEYMLGCYCRDQLPSFDAFLLV